MRIEWSEQTVRWFEAASEYTGFHDKLASLLLEHMPMRGTLADLGCGSGMIDLALAPHFKSITCIDNNADVLRSLDTILAERGIANLHTLRADASTLEGRWDNVLSIFYSRLSDHIKHSLSLCNDALICVTHAKSHGKFAPKGYHAPRMGTMAHSVQALDAMGVRYTLIEDAYEYGQPLRSREEALAFVRAYNKNIPEEALDEYLRSHIMETGQGKYPYYLPNHKPFGIFIIRREDNAHI